MAGSRAFAAPRILPSGKRKEAVILECQCGQKVEVPDQPLAGAAYVCNRCFRAFPSVAGAAEIPAAGKNRGKRLKRLGGGALAIFLMALCAVLFYNTPPAEVEPGAPSSWPSAAVTGPGIPRASGTEAGSRADETVDIPAPDALSGPAREHVSG